MKRKENFIYSIYIGSKLKNKRKDEEKKTLVKLYKMKRLRKLGLMLKSA